MERNLYNCLDVRFLARIIEFEAHLMLAGLKFRMISGFRSCQAQQRLYELGRGRGGRIVTNSRSGESYHNYGLAADYCIVETPPAEEKTAWARFGAVARSCGLVWGGDFKDLRDLGHVQCPARLPNKRPKSDETVSGRLVK